MASAEIEETIPVSKKRLLEVICAYEEYPDFVEGVKSISVERVSDSEAHVTYEVNIMKKVQYTLKTKEDLENGKISWTLAGESDFFTKNSGFWEIEPQGENTCFVRYGVDVEFKVPVPGFILKKLVKGNLPKVVENFKNRALSRYQ